MKLINNLHYLGQTYSQFAWAGLDEFTVDVIYFRFIVTIYVIYYVFHIGHITLLSLIIFKLIIWSLESFDILTIFFFIFLHIEIMVEEEFTVVNKAQIKF